MSTGYRKSAGPSPVVVGYTLMRRVHALVVTAAFALVALVIVAFSHRVELTCDVVDRAHGSCTSTDWSPFGMGTTRTVTLEGLDGAEIDGNDDVTMVSLVVNRRRLTLSTMRERWLTASKARMVEDVRLFVKDPKPGFSTGYGSRWANGAPLLAIEALVFAIVMWTGSWRVRVTVDSVAREVVFEQRRPFFASRIRSLPLRSIEGVAVDTTRGPRRSTKQNLVIVRDDGTREPLPVGFYPYGGDLEQVSAMMDAAIRDARGTGQG